MTFNDHLPHLGGKEVVDWHIDEPLPDPATSVPALRLDYEEADSGEVLDDDLMALVEDPAAAQLTGLVIGQWGDFEAQPDSLIQTLVAVRDKLPNLTHLFIGDITYEELEVSWIQQTDLSPLFFAYPKLEYFGVRGGEQLSLGAIYHDTLKHIVVETGGLPGAVLHEVQKSSLPALEHLELWLGTENYGWNGSIEDVRPLLTLGLFPALKYLGLRNSEIADDIAKAVVESGILEHIEVLDLSLGTLGDEGGQALLDAPALLKLKKLDLHHHYLSEELIKKFEALPIEVDLDEAEKLSEDYDPDWHYVAIGE